MVLVSNGCLSDGFITNNVGEMKQYLVDLLNDEDMAKEIKELEVQLADMKKAYREKRMAGLKSAMEARKSADEAVRDELKALGVTSYSSSWPSDPFKLYTKWD